MSSEKKTSKQVNPSNNEANNKDNKDDMEILRKLCEFYEKTTDGDVIIDEEWDGKTPAVYVRAVWPKELQNISQRGTYVPSYPQTSQHPKNSSAKNVHRW